MDRIENFVLDMVRFAAPQRAGLPSDAGMAQQAHCRADEIAAAIARLEARRVLFVEVRGAHRRFLCGVTWALTGWGRITPGGGAFGAEPRTPKIETPVAGGAFAPEARTANTPVAGGDFAPEARTANKEYACAAHPPGPDARRAGVAARHGAGACVSPADAEQSERAASAGFLASLRGGARAGS
jgi:hypothetical protein